MRCAYFDCFSGAAGDMILAALLDAGLEPSVLHDCVARLGLPGVGLTIAKVRRGGLAATHVTVNVGPEARRDHRHLPKILQIIASAALPASVSALATRIFERLAAAEAAVHGIPIDKVHFHEVGAADAIVDIVGACAGIAALGIEATVCSPIPTGSGVVHCDHGVLPVPAPATAELLRGVPLATCDEPGELTTPTGAVILTSVAGSYGPLPPMRIDHVGYGAGTREGSTRPNLLRLFIGELAASRPGEEDLVAVLETQLDDATGQTIAYTVARLLTAGALDAFVVPIVMKKGRPGQLLTVLARPEQVATLEDVLFRETTTFGVRRHECSRRILAREHTTVETAFGPIRVKVGRRDGQVLQAWPEFEDCATAATKFAVPLRAVQDAAIRAWTEQHDSRQPGNDQ